MRTESSLETTFNRLIRQAGGRSYKMAPTTAGIPDRLVLLPGGRVFLVELKREKENPSPIQNLWHAQAAELGTDVVTLRGLTEIRSWCTEQALNLPPRKFSPVRNAIVTLRRARPRLSERELNQIRELL